ncbi:MAG: exodeoxyribonuclease V subunit gamma [Acidobacteriota bacterium]
MSLRILRAPSFRTLLDHLMTDLEASCRRDPFSPRWVATPTSTLAADLRIRLAERAGDSVLSSVRVLPLTRLVQRLISRWSGEAPVARSTLLDLLTHELVGRLDSGSALGTLNQIDGGFSLLTPVFQDLADAGMTSDQCRLLLEAVETRSLSAMARGVMEFFGTWAETVEALGVAWQPLLHGRLNDWLSEVPADWLLRVLSAETGQEVEIFVYGFYDFTDLNLGTLGALSRLTPVELLLPGAQAQANGRSCPVFDFADEVLAEILVRNPAATVEVLTSSEPSTRYFLETFPDGRIGERPEFLTCRRSSGIDAEALAAAVQTQTWLDAEPDLRLQDILVLAPDAERYHMALERVFRDFGIPLTTLDLESEQNLERRPIQYLERLHRERASSERVLSYLRDFPAVGERKGIELDGFEGKVRALRLFGGAAWAWLDQRLDDEPESVEAISGTFVENERRLIKEVRDLWVDPTGSADVMSATDALEWAERLRSWLPDPTLLDSSIEDIRDFAELLPGAVVSRRSLFAMFLEGAAQRSGSGSPAQAGVRLISLMRARGLVARKVVLLGMSANLFPQAFGDEPLLSEADRIAVFQAAAALGHRFPAKSQVLPEMTLLFFLVNSGCDSLHWVIPESDENGKAVAPSPWLSRYLNAWARNGGPAAGSEPAAAESRIPRSPLEQAAWLLQLDPVRGGFLPPGYGACLHSPLARLSLDEEYDYLVASLRRKEEDAWNGSIPTATLDQLSSKERFSVSELELLAKCPFRFWASALAGIGGVEPLVWEGELSALDRGQLVHHCLDWLVRTCLETGMGLDRMPELMEGAVREGGFLDSEVRGLLLFLPPVFRRSALREIEALVQAYLRSVSGRVGADFAPLRSEVKIRRSFPGAEDRLVSGTLDRIDRREGQVWIVDYKTAKSPFSGRAEKSPLLKIGFIAQPILYPWLCESLEGDWRPSGFSFIYLREDPPREVELRELPAAGEFLSQLKAFLEQGIYPLLSSRAYEVVGLKNAVPCSGCELASLCRRFDRGAEMRGVRLLAKAAPTRYETLRAVGGECVAE